MKKRLLVTTGILIASVLLVLAGLSLFIKSYLKSENLKALIIPKAEEFTGRKVAVDAIQVSIFRGIVVKGIAVKEQDGTTDFLKVREFILDYHLLPLLKRQLVITKIDFISPFIAVRKTGEGTYNLDDILRRTGGRKRPEAAGPDKEKGLPFSVVADRVSAKDVQVEFRDETGGLPDMTARIGLELSLSSITGGMKKGIEGRLSLHELKGNLKGTEIRLSGVIEARKESLLIDFTSVVGKDTITIKGAAKDYMNSPDLRLDLFAKELDLERLAAFGGKGGDEAKTVKKAGAGPARAEARRREAADGVKASGEVRLDTGRYKDYLVRDFKMNYRYSNGMLFVDPLSFSLSGGGAVKTEGVVKGELQAAIEPQAGGDTDIKKSVRGRGVAELSKCEVSRSKVTEGAALLTGIEDLKNPRFDRVLFNFTLKEEKIFFDGTMESPNLKTAPKGAVGFDRGIDALTDLRLSPQLSAKLPTGKLVSYSKDKDGWSVIPLKVGGTTENPSVTLNTAALGKHLGRGIAGEILKEGQPSKGKNGGGLFKGLFGK